ncbi:MAG: TetR/AcrR family transcriptional regulator [Polyangiaceae bacterium]|nr:TetR/AcrR family transcriptional regulator [Polyangiaceae bacterium]
MARSIPPDRLRQLVDVATDVFVTQGYQRTQMEDVARALGVGKGTLYVYVEGKAALFDAALRYADGHEALPEASALPLANPAPGATAATLRARLAAGTRDLALVAAMGRAGPCDPAVELTAIVRDLYERLASNRRAIKLVDRCASELPELAAVWFDEGRWAQHAALAHYLDRRVAEGSLRPVPSTAVAARTLLELIAFWAVHRHWDPSPQRVAEEDVRGTVVVLALHGLVKESS